MLVERLKSDLAAAMRAGEELRRETLRMCIAALSNRRIELGRDLEEAEELQVLSKAAKTREDSAEQYRQAGRPELADKERSEAQIILAYLPQKLGEAETRELVEKRISELGLSSKKDMGRLMKAVMAEEGARVDGKTVQRLAAELLS
jgi:uncharacterized protein YqeY